jgi:hypothetical protein
MSARGIDLWHCPVNSALGLDCPGCGLTRAALALLQGDLGSALSLHAFAPLLVMGAFLYGAVRLLPGRSRASLLRSVGRLDRRWRLSAILACGLVAYWLARQIWQVWTERHFP